MRRLGTALALALIALATAAAQSSGDYLKLRKSHHIVQPITSQDLNQLVGTKVVELKGIIQGSFKGGGSISLMLQMTDGDPVILNCPTAPPDWVLNGTVSVRALVTVSRPEPKAAPTVDLISLGQEADVEKVDEAYWAAEASKKQARTTKPLASRSGLRRQISRSYQGLYLTEEKFKELLKSNAPKYAHFMRYYNPRLSSQEALDIARNVIWASYRVYGLDPRLPMAVFMVESNFDPYSTNAKSGAMGMGQLMPGTASWMGVRNPYDSVDNVLGAIKLLKTHFDQYYAVTRDMDRAVRLTLAAYNAGEGAVRKYGGIPPYPETQAYVNRVISLYLEISKNDPSPPFFFEN